MFSKQHILLLNLSKSSLYIFCELNGSHLLVNLIPSSNMEKKMDNIHSTIQDSIADNNIVKSLEYDV